MGSIYPVPPTISNPISPPPQVFTTANGTLQGLIDGVNALYTAGVVLKQATAFRNGQELTLNFDVCIGGQAVQILRPEQILQPGPPPDILTVLGYPAP
jgi:hypothetical protein